MWWVLHALLFQVLCSLCDTLRTCFWKTLSGSKVLFDHVNRNEHRHLHVSLRWSGRLLATKRSRSLSTDDPSLSFVAKLRVGTLSVKETFVSKSFKHLQHYHARPCRVSFMSRCRIWVQLSGFGTPFTPVATKLSLNSTFLWCAMAML